MRTQATHQVTYCNTLLKKIAFSFKVRVNTLYAHLNQVICITVLTPTAVQFSKKIFDKQLKIIRSF